MSKNYKNEYLYGDSEEEDEKRYKKTKNEKNFPDKNKVDDRDEEKKRKRD